MNAIGIFVAGLIVGGVMVKFRHKILPKEPEKLRGTKPNERSPTSTTAKATT